MQKKDSSIQVVAVLLIAFGLLWMLRQLNSLPFFPELHRHLIIFPFTHLAQAIGHTIFSWQVILLLTGLVLVAGKRASGVVLIVIGGIFLLPEIMHFSYWSFPFLLPVLLIVAGLIMVRKASINLNH